MIHVRKRIGFAIVFCLLTTGISFGSELTRLFLDGIKDYQNAHYEDAIRKFSAVADGGVINGKLYYNLGNAHLKNGDVGLALLWYERAEKLIPNDPDLKFNMDYARSMVKDIKDEKGHTIYRVLFFWKYLLSPEVIKWAAISLNAVFWAILITGGILKKNPSKMIPGIIVIIAAVFTLTALYNFYEERHVQYAIVISDTVPVRSGFSEDATELFVLHAGTKIRVEKNQGDYYRIYFSKGKIGWVPKSSAGLI